MENTDDLIISLIKKAIDDTFNQVHYSHLHPEITPPIEHNKWREDWIKENIKGSLKGSITVMVGKDSNEMLCKTT